MREADDHAIGRRALHGEEDDGSLVTAVICASLSDGMPSRSPRACKPNSRSAQIA